MVVLKQLRRRPAVLVAAVLLVALAVFVTFLVRSPQYSCNGPAVARAIGVEPPSLPELESVAAVEAYAAAPQALASGEVVRAESWFEDGGRRYLQIDDRRRVEIVVVEQADGQWAVAGQGWICTRS